MGEQKRSNILIDSFSIICGILQAFLIFLFPSGLTENGELALYLFKVAIAITIFTLFFYSIRELIKLKLRLTSKTGIYFSNSQNLPNYLYYFASAIGMFIIISVRPLDFIGYIIIVASIIINFLVISRKNKSTNIESFYQDLYEENKKSNDNRKKIVKKEIICIVKGIVVGIIVAIPLLVSYLIFNNNNMYNGSNGEMMLFITIVIGFLSVLLIPIIVGLLYSKRNHDEKYWLYENIINNSYIIMSALSYFIVLAFVIKMDYFYSAGIGLICYFISAKRIGSSYEVDLNAELNPDRSLNNYIASDRAREERKKNYGVSTATFVDSKGNYAGSATSHNIGGIETTVYKDKEGNVTGEATSYDIGGVRHTNYKKS